MELISSVADASKDVESFLNSRFKAVWMEFPEFSVFVRKSYRLHPVSLGLVLAFDVANIQVKPEYRGKGLFSSWIETLPDLLKPKGYLLLFVESVLTERFAQHFRSKKWIELPHHPMNFYREL